MLISLILIFALAACGNIGAGEESEINYPFEIEWMQHGEEVVPKYIKGENIDVAYLYNDDCYRIAKDVNGKVSNFEYEKSFYHDTYQLVQETRDGEKIEYLYRTYGELYDDMEVTGASEDAVVYDRDYLYGFIYNGKTYEYVRGDDGYISGISDSEGNELARYEYEGRVVTQILGMNESGEWVDMSNDETFIGVFNKIRVGAEYYDDETGWYCNWGGFYEDPVNNNVIMPAEEEEIIYSYEAPSHAPSHGADIADGSVSEL